MGFSASVPAFRLLNFIASANEFSIASLN